MDNSVPGGVAPVNGWRVYRYAGPREFMELVRAGRGGRVVRGPADLTEWLASQDPQERTEPLTYVVGTDGLLRVAPRRSEHVVCAEGGPVLAAGELTLSPDALTLSPGTGVVAVSNQSTGYCPDPDCWPAVAAALDRAGIDRPSALTDPVVFRRCPGCGERNLVKDGFFVCALCDADLPAEWNLGPVGGFGDGSTEDRTDGAR